VRQEDLAATGSTEPARDPVAYYWDALKVALSDLQVTDAEIEQLLAIRRQLDLRPEQVRAIHARAFAGIMCEFADDQHLDDTEADALQRIRTGLQRLGWAPGD
jgi:DNA polymerase-3 subunit epsilon